MAHKAGAALTLLALLAVGVPRAFGAAAPWEPTTMQCTPWSWQVCAETEPGTYQVACNADGGGGMQAPGHFLNGQFSLRMKLPAGNSGGVNFAWYLMDTISPNNADALHSEIDMEFYGDTDPANVMLALNVFANGKQNLAQYRLPFDPSADFHTYAIQWSAEQIAWSVDGQVLRLITRQDGAPWPTHAMKPMASVWSTPWTALKADFSNGPVSALFSGYQADGCRVAEDAVQALPQQCDGDWNAPAALDQQLHDQAVLNDYGWDNV